MKQWLLAIVVSIASSALLHAQSTIVGRVLADDSRDPVPNARVALNLPNDDGRIVVVSDKEGRFVLDAPSGRHSIVASKTGFARGQITAAGDQPVEIRL